MRGPTELTANDLWPLVEKLSDDERVALARRALASALHPRSDADAYRAKPPQASEFGDDGDGDPMAWEAEGWDDYDATR